MNGTTPIRLARKQAGLSGELLAQRVGISVAWLRTIERAPGLASPQLLAKVAAALGVPVEALVSRRHGAPSPRCAVPGGRE
jgi:transcriptional regulator with XRE-family HTH domain